MHLESESLKLQHQELFLLLQSAQNERNVAVSASSSADATAAVVSQLHRDESLLLIRQAHNSGMCYVLHARDIGGMTCDMVCRCFGTSAWEPLSFDSRPVAADTGDTDTWSVWNFVPFLYCQLCPHHRHPLHFCTSLCPAGVIGIWENGF